MSLKVILFSNSYLSLPTLGQLITHQQIAGIVLPDRMHQENAEIMQIATAQGIPVKIISKEGLKEELPLWLNGQGCEAILTATFPWKLPEEIIGLPAKGAFNIHFGELPARRGADPVFMTIKDGDKEACISIHEMSKELDAGAVVLSHKVPHIPGETWGILAGKLSIAAASLADQLLLAIEGGTLAPVPQPAEDKTWHPRPDEEMLSIHWDTDEANTIEALVNACNPSYGGAKTFLKGAPVQILEVTPADVNDAPIAKPGTIVYADQQYGIFVLCKDYNFLRITTLNTRQGILSGNKMAALGIKAGDQFSDTPIVQQ